MMSAKHLKSCIFTVFISNTNEGLFFFSANFSTYNNIIIIMIITIPTMALFFSGVSDIYTGYGYIQP